MSEANKDSENHVALAAESPEAGRSSTAAHTKGPWAVHREGNYLSIISPAGDAELGNWMVAERVRWPDDASLIVAAPAMSAEIVRLKALNVEMLAALEIGLNLVEKIWPMCGAESEPEKSTLKFINAGRAAIARTGGQER